MFFAFISLNSFIASLSIPLFTVTFLIYKATPESQNKNGKRKIEDYKNVSINHKKKVRTHGDR